MVQLELQVKEMQVAEEALAVSKMVVEVVALVLLELLASVEAQLVA
jgi:hypothetical protein